MSNGTIVDRKERNSSVELLRILAACAVVVLHYNGLGGAFSAASGGAKEGLLLLECLCVCAVDLFIMISGYYLVSSNRRTWDKPVYLLLQLSFISVIAYFINCFITGEGIKAITIAHLVIPPHNYFVILYLVTYIVSPYLNIVLNSLSEKGRTSFIIVLLLLFSIYPTLIDSYQIMMRHEYMGISTVGAWGQQHGYTIVNFILSYCLGAWLRLKSKRITNARVLLSLLGISVLIIYVWYTLEKLYFLGDVDLIDFNAFSYSNPIVLFESILLLAVFSSRSFHNKLINVLARATFVCYILHLSVLPHLHIEDYARGGGFTLSLHLFFTVTAIYFVSWAVWRFLEWFLVPVVKLVKSYPIVNIDEK